MMNLWKHLIFVLLCVFSAVSQAAWSVRYQHTDVLGSVIAESNAQGTITQRFGYKPFGEGSPTQKTGVGYTGHLEDTDLGLTYMQQRYYDPVIGRFYSNDPIGFRDTQSFNRYSYANNNPYKYVDPTGMASQQTDSFCGVSGCDYSYKSGDSSEGKKEGGEQTDDLTGAYSPVSGEYPDQEGNIITVELHIYSNGSESLLSVDGVTAYHFDYKTGLIVNQVATGSVESVCPSCYLVGGGTIKSAWKAFNGWVVGTLGGPKVGHRLFTATRKNGSWNSGKLRFGWSGKNGSDVYQLMIRYKGKHYPIGIKTTKAHPSGG